jgi:hypothetical protein
LLSGSPSCWPIAETTRLLYYTVRRRREMARRAGGSAKNGAPVGLGMRSTSDWPVAFEFSMESQRESGNIGNWGCAPRLARTATTSFGSLLGRPIGRSSALWMPPATIMGVAVGPGCCQSSLEYIHIFTENDHRHELATPAAGIVLEGTSLFRTRKAGEAFVANACGGLCVDMLVGGCRGAPRRSIVDSRQ